MIAFYRLNSYDISSNKLADMSKIDLELGEKDHIVFGKDEIIKELIRDGLLKIDCKKYIEANYGKFRDLSVIWEFSK